MELEFDFKDGVRAWLATHKVEHAGQELTSIPDGARPTQQQRRQFLQNALAAHARAFAARVCRTQTCAGTRLQCTLPEEW
jgi:hypothetical protein